MSVDAMKRSSLPVNGPEFEGGVDAHILSSPGWDDLTAPISPLDASEMVGIDDQNILPAATEEAPLQEFKPSQQAMISFLECQTQAGIGVQPKVLRQFAPAGYKSPASYVSVLLRQLAQHPYYGPRLYRTGSTDHRRIWLGDTTEAVKSEPSESPDAVDPAGPFTPHEVLMLRHLLTNMGKVVLTKTLGELIQGDYVDASRRRFVNQFLGKLSTTEYAALLRYGQRGNSKLVTLLSRETITTVRS